MKDFFKDKNNINILKDFSNKIDLDQHLPDFELRRNKFIKRILISMVTQSDEWDKSCQINIAWIGDNLISRLSEEKEHTKDFLDEICADLYRFFFELYLSMESELSHEFESDRVFIVSNVDKFEIHAADQIRYALHQMPISLFKRIANSEEISSVKDFNAFMVAAEKKKEEWNADLTLREDKVNILRDSLVKYENAFNFVGLYQGFDELGRQKANERDVTLFWLKIMACVVISPILIEIVIILLNFENISSLKDLLLVSFFPTASLVVIIIYYFRILLSNYKSVKAQLLQIELRKTLCRFIQNYSDYSAPLKKQDSEALAKFENIIFSGLVSDDSNLPSTYDGVEQISNLIKSIKS